ncbi:MAG: hypothetical protein LBT37_07205 [Lactobacillaceae bacterium]|jgi:hypothetical protein|nr:hypothetical protein [Lactobacillaceae bacterium]
MKNSDYKFYIPLAILIGIVTFVTYQLKLTGWLVVSLPTIIVILGGVLYSYFKK